MWGNPLVALIIPGLLLLGAIVFMLWAGSKKEGMENKKKTSKGGFIALMAVLGAGLLSMLLAGFFLA